MGIFTRVRDIISSNLNAMLDHAEDPEKLVRLMIGEMEDTLVEIKAHCADAMASKKRLGRERDAILDKAQGWERRARVAVDKGRDDLAREALTERKHYQERAQVLDSDLALADEHIAQYQEDMRQLEEKLALAREKQRSLLARHTRAQDKRRAHSDMRRFDTAEAMMRFEQFESRIDRMEAEADLVRPRKTTGQPDLESRFREIEHDEDVERELARIKGTGQSGPSGQSGQSGQSGADR